MLVTEMFWGWRYSRRVGLDVLTRIQRKMLARIRPPAISMAENDLDFVGLEKKTTSGAKSKFSGESVMNLLNSRRPV